MPRILILCALMLLSSTKVTYANPFSAFDGHWRGKTKGEVSKGVTEDLTCTSTNGLQGANSIRITLRCVNAASANLQIRASASASTEKLTGTWEERSYNIQGVMTGTIKADEIIANIVSDGFKASLRVTRKPGDTPILEVALLPAEGTGKFTVAMSR